jgi:hypothetical protein
VRRDHPAAAGLLLEVTRNSAATIERTRAWEQPASQHPANRNRASGCHPRRHRVILNLAPATPRELTCGQLHHQAGHEPISSSGPGRDVDGS